ncbi:MAG: DUF2809 domain-containing protein [Cellulosilyticaceae bacterium]
MFFIKRMTRGLNRNRMVYSVLIILTIVLGLATRQFGSYLPSFIAIYAGDTLWVLMAFLLLGFIFKKSSILMIGMLALLASYGIEASQLYSAPWIDTIRTTTLGGLVLGKGFLWSDIVCYTVGVLTGVIGEYRSYKLDFLFINR